MAFVLVLGLSGVAQAAFVTLGVYDPDDAPHHNQVDQSGVYDSHTGNAGPINVIDLATFQALIGPAFNADGGGVVDAETANGSMDDQDIIANFGVSRTKSLTISSTSGTIGRGSGGGSGNRLPTSGDARFYKSGTGDFVFDISTVTGGEPGEVVTYFAGTLSYRDNSDMNPQVTATFSGGGTVTAVADMTAGAPSNSRDTFFGFVAPPDESIVNVNFDLANYTHLDDVAFITSAFIVVSKKASYPGPANKAIDVPRNVALSWTAGDYANKHDVYFDTDESKVTNASRTDPLDVLVSPNQDANAYTPTTNLEFGKTYYWRIDEVNSPPDDTIYQGDVWNFKVEPIAYAIENITATASSQDEDQGPENTVDGSGLTNDLHTNATADMWLSSTDDLGPAWIEYEFDKVYKLHEMWVWNYNGEGLNTVYGLKNVTIEYSTDGNDYTKLGDTHEFAQAPGASGYEHNAPIDFSGVTAKYVRITANSNWIGAIYNQYGLSEVRFFYIPIRAREPSPESGATDVNLDVALSWRKGREAAEHNVYISPSWKDVVNGTAPMYTVAEATYGPLFLDLGETYFWRVDEVNDPENPEILEGDVWNFTTHEFLVVDDFEDYNTTDKQIWAIWHEGIGYWDLQGVFHPGNGTGSGVGDEDNENSYMEETIVNSGSQSMTYFFNNSGSTGKAYYSEAKLTLSSMRDWTKDGVKALTLWFRGNPAGFVEAPVGTYTISASGEDIWDESDEFRYAFKQLSGAGSIVVQVLSVENTDDWAKAGIMIRETLDADSRFAAVYITPTKADGTAEHGCRFQMRAITGGSATSDSSPTLVATEEQMAITSPYWVKLERTGMNEFNAYYSSDPATDPWHLMVWSPRVIQMTNDVYIGLALTGHNPDAICKAEFSDVQTTGMITSDQWTHQAIGATMISNDPERMYVAISNSNGTTGTVYYEDNENIDPNATLFDSWTEFNIDLKDFQNQGVNLADVNSIAIGFGTRGNTTTPDGSGKMYFDDIRLYPSRCILSRRSDDFAEVDYIEDCVVNYNELEVMAGQWLFEEVTPGSAGHIWIEAESAGTMSDPMQVLSDSTASGGQYIAVAPGNSSGNNPPTAGVATYDFDVQAGVYTIIGRTIAPSGTDDSFWARIEGATTQTQTNNNISGWFKWSIVHSNDWSWTPARSMDDDYETVYFTMDAGTYTLEIAYREDGALLDRFLITDDLELDPVALSPLAADLNGNKKVDFKDYALTAEMWLDEQMWPEP
jgi:hypothetical protein